MTVAQRTGPVVDTTTGGDGPAPIGDVRWRQRVRVRGHVRSMRVRPWAEGVSTLEATLVDETGGITLVFLGRKKILGLSLGRRARGRGHGRGEP